MDIGTGISEFCRKYPDRYIDVGIAESHALTYASGLATEDIIPVVTIYSTFMQRAYDQIMHDILLQNLPVVLCMDRAGVVGADGEGTLACALPATAFPMTEISDISYTFAVSRCDCFLK